MQTQLGRVRQLSKKHGFSVEDYYQKRTDGFKWCCGCKDFHPFDMFYKNDDTYDQLSGACKETYNIYRRKRITAERQNLIPTIMQVDKLTTSVKIQN